jgi:hypothetical protein
MGVWYSTREDVKAALNYSESAIGNRRIDRAIEAASRAIDGQMRRVFYPTDDTRTFDWMDHQYSLTWRLWLDHNELAAPATTVLSNGEDLTTSCLFRPDAGPPFTKVEIDLSTSDSFEAGFTYQRAVSITGTFGYQIAEANEATLSALNSSATTATISDGSAVGTGSLIRVGTERLIVTAIGPADSGTTLTGDLASNNGATLVPVGTGTGFHIGEVILVDSERMYVTDVVGNSLVVKRAWDGSVLAAHDSGSTVYAYRSLTLSRAVLGTTATMHSADSTIAVFVFPGLIHQLTVAEAATNLLQEASGYARAIGTDTVLETIGKGLIDLRKQAMALHGRKLRTRTAARFL